jgi:hypothetical protein
METPKTQMEAVILGLFLALTAPTDEKAQEVAALTEQIASGMTEAEIAYAKEQAEAKYDKETN